MMHDDRVAGVPIAGHFEGVGTVAYVRDVEAHLLSRAAMVRAALSRLVGATVTAIEAQHGISVDRAHVEQHLQAASAAINVSTADTIEQVRAAAIPLRAR